MSLIALPPLFAATREGLQAVPAQVREAAFALGKTRIATIRRVLIPSVRSSIATGATLGISRIVGDTAIVIVVLAEGAPRNEPVASTPILGFLRGTGSALTSFVYGDSPAGEGNSPTKAYAAAFVLLLMVLGLNWIVTRLTRTGADGTKRGGFRLLFILALNGIVGLIARAHARSSGFDAGEGRL